MCHYRFYDEEGKPIFGRKIFDSEVELSNGHAFESKLPRFTV